MRVPAPQARAIYRNCEGCGAPLTRKRFPSGRLETNRRFNLRRTCSTTCRDRALIEENRRQTRRLVAIGDDGAIHLPLFGRGGQIRAYVIIDAADLEWALEWRWRLLNGYAIRSTSRQGSMIGIHRDIMGLVPGDGLEVDHIDGNPLNNRRSNLRVVTHAQNHQNRCGPDKQSTSGYRNVTWNHDHERWQVIVQIDGKKRRAGLHDTPEAASRAAEAFRREHMPYSKEALR